MIDRFLAPYRRFWETDRGLSLLLVFVVAILFVVPLLPFKGTVARLTLDVSLTALLIAGIGATSVGRTVRVGLTAVVIATLALRWLGWLSTSELIDWSAGVSILVSTGILATVVLMRVFRDGRVTYDRILGAIVVYLLLGLTWAQAYILVARIAPDAFNLTAAHGSTPYAFFYYSIVTLTTVGYGDITPVRTVARSLAMLEALTGQLYPAILLARLVSLEITGRDKA